MGEGTDVKPSDRHGEEEEEEEETETQKRSRMEDSSVSAKADSNSSSEQKTENQSSKKRKVYEKTVVAVKIEADSGKHKNECPPSDSWSWRKYGQKPIKGSPYPRGYYRCSTSKGCSAKKQVERCKTDASLIIITYTSTHNHPGPDINTNKLNNEELPPPPCDEQTNDTREEEFTEDHDLLYFQPPIIHQQEEDSLMITLDKTHDSFDLILDEEPLSYTNIMNFSSIPKSEENDFYDDLEELPTTSSSFTSFVRSNFFDERNLVLPSLSIPR
ncbi:hypothetical protein GIB67_001280 [Kingdonia uniflora]|uniref:WRKY domain-containing protein n=1 Tax=Kingdonia uniflora TaxID=39325 RepID=A0A7J7LL07_9MAGN|nr:hypothetical protein GIB67_001280 [Kingdonia uniflora]